MVPRMVTFQLAKTLAMARAAITIANDGLENIVDIIQHTKQPLCLGDKSKKKKKKKKKNRRRRMQRPSTAPFVFVFTVLLANTFEM